MRLFFLVAFAAILAAPHTSVASPTTKEREQAVAMVNRVIAMYKKDGPKATFAAVDNKTSKQFHQGRMYVFIFTLKGTCVAHGARPALIGKNLYDMTDPDGKYFIRDMIAIAKGPGHGWITYKWPTPFTNRITNKTSYIAGLADYFVGAGFYGK